MEPRECWLMMSSASQMELTPLITKEARGTFTLEGVSLTTALSRGPVKRYLYLLVAILKETRSPFRRSEFTF